jgi:hypothetical protein
LTYYGINAPVPYLIADTLANKLTISSKLIGRPDIKYK